MRVKLNLSQLTKKADEAFRETALIVAREMTEVISDSNKFPSHPGQDIVDTGRLRSSQQINFPSVGLAVFSYPVDYSIYVYMGYTTRSGREVQGRPWMKAAIDNVNVPLTYAKILSSKLL